MVRFKHHFSNLVPLAPFLLISTPLPSHPFVRLAVLVHTPQQSDLFPLIEESVLTVNAGAVGPDVPLALLILSLAPNPSDRHRASLTAIRLIALAHSIGQMLGWDAMSEVWLESPLLNQREWAPILDQILLVSA